MSVRYLHLPEGREPPALDAQPFKAVVVLEHAIDQDWRDHVSDWLVRSGCLYMMAWGPDCASWDSSVDEANLALFGFGDVPDDAHVMTTWHEKESLAEAFWYAGFCAFHPTRTLEHTLIVHIGPEDRSGELLAGYAEAQELVA